MSTNFSAPASPCPVRISRKLHSNSELKEEEIWPTIYETVDQARPEFERDIQSLPGQVAGSRSIWRDLPRARMAGRKRRKV